MDSKKCLESKGFRPLDGESISKRDNYGLYLSNAYRHSFRPLDGESISKQQRTREELQGYVDSSSFRPLDGESISKLYNNKYCRQYTNVQFPSPRRGINF